MKVQAFYEIDSSYLEEQLKDNLKKEIEGKGKDYILGVDENEFKKYLISEFTLHPLTIDNSTEHIEKPTTSKEYREDSFY